jgi:hypothetical protein
VLPLFNNYLLHLLVVSSTVVSSTVVSSTGCFIYWLFHLQLVSSTGCLI